MKKILVCANADRVGTTEFIVEKILARGLTARVYSPFRPLEGFKYPQLITAAPEQDAKGADLLICMGGDGTILSCSKLAARASLPVLGINYGHKGFIAALEPDEIAALDDVLDGRFTTEDRMMLSACVTRAGQPVCSGVALNEAVVRSAGAHPIGVRVFADGAEITAFSGDGIIIATPTGSTAYSMSAGGPIVEPSARNLIITPICAHALNAKTVVLRDDRTVTIRLKRSASFEAVMSLDGDRPFALEADDEICVSRSELFTRLLVGNDRSFYEIVKRKLNTDM